MIDWVEIIIAILGYSLAFFIYNDIKSKNKN
jgi:hypothetical protein